MAANAEQQLIQHAYTRQAQRPVRKWRERAADLVDQPNVTEQARPQRDAIGGLVLR